MTVDPSGGPGDVTRKFGHSLTGYVIIGAVSLTETGTELCFRFEAYIGAIMVNAPGMYRVTTLNLGFIEEKLDRI